MDYAKTAEQVIKYVGGKDNIKSVAHCATRLRFQLRNNDLRDEEAINGLEGVKGVFLTQSQFQIIFGSGTVNLVFAEVQKQLGTLEVKEDEREEKEGNPLQRFIKMLSDIFVPIIPAIVAGGLLMGLNNLLTSPLLHGQSVIQTYPQWQGLAAAINTFASAPFTFLPVLIGFSAAKKFGGNAFLGAAMGMIMVHPDLLNAYQIGVAEPPVWNVLGFKIAAIGYQGTVLPVLAVSWIIANIEKRLRRVTPSWLDNLTTPLLSILITSFLTFAFVGPVLREAGNLLASGITWLYNTLGPVGGALFGLTYAPITMTGMHHSFIAIETQLLADSVHTGVLAVLLLTKNERMKSICSASGISALLGITEPAMFGVTLKLKYPFYAAIIGSGVGSAYLAWTKTLAQALGAAGLPGFISMKPEEYGHFAIGLVLSMGVSFLLTVIFWKKFGLDKAERVEKKDKADQTQPAEKQSDVPDASVFVSPMKGRVMPVEQSADEMFAAKMLGDGIAVDPEDGTVYAPCDGTVSLLFPTRHAIGIKADTGVEVLIHIGINTVQMEGEGFEAFTEQGARVCRGDRLICADLDRIRAEGYNPQTMMIFPEGKDLEVTVYANEQGDEKTMAAKVRRTQR